MDDPRAWCAEQDPLRALAKLRRLRLVIDESLTSCVAADVCADRIPDDYDDKYAYAANDTLDLRYSTSGTYDGFSTAAFGLELTE